MDCVRPGVELVRAILAPSRELSTLDLPTFDRPKKAISGSTGAGKWSTPVAEPMNLERTRTLQFRVSDEKLQVGSAQSSPRGRLFSTSLSPTGKYLLRR